MNEFDGKPPAGWLDHLSEAGHWNRLIEMGMRSLAAEPNDPPTHRHLAWAYAKTRRPREMWRHVDFLLKAEPEEPRNHHLAAVYYLDTQQHKKAQTHIDLLLRENPSSPTYQYLACIQCLRQNYVRSARLHIQRARALAPNWAAAAHLEINIDGIGQKRSRETWARVRRLKETLALDPREASVMTTIGDILFQQLERPREAEHFYREALLIEPTDKIRQGKLLDSIRARSLFYRTLSLPMSVARAAGRSIKEGKRRWILLFYAVILFKVVLFVAAWAVAMGVFFAPAAVIYEWLVLADLPRTTALPRILAPLQVARRWPLWLRMGAACTTIIGVWLLILWRLFQIAPGKALAIMAATFGVHFAAVALLVGCRRLSARVGEWQEARRLRREKVAAPSAMGVV